MASSTSRKRKTQDLDPSDQESSDVAPKQRKSKSNTTAKSSNTDREANKLYKDTIKAIDTATDKLDRLVKGIKHENRYDITTENYAGAIRKHLPAAKNLEDLDLKLGFNLMMVMADASHCSDLDATPKMCGCGDSEPVFKLLDKALLALILRRAGDLPITTEVADLPKVPARWTPEDAAVGEIKGEWPTKQQRNQMYTQKLNHEKERRAARRQRREVADDWMAVAVGDLVEERDYLKLYGVKG